MALSQSTAPPTGFRLAAIRGAVSSTCWFSRVASCSSRTPGEFEKGRTFYNTASILPPGEQMQKSLLAISVADGKRAWSCTQTGQGISCGGTLTTAGGLVFFGDDANSLEAGEATTGRALAFQHRPNQRCFADALRRRSIRGNRCWRRPLLFFSARTLKCAAQDDSSVASSLRPVPLRFRAIMRDARFVMRSAASSTRIPRS
jgi:hypothetical protein